MRVRATLICEYEEIFRVQLHTQPFHVAVRDLNPGPQHTQQAPLPTEPSPQPWENLTPKPK